MGGPCRGANRSMKHAHQQCCRNAFTRDVTQDHRNFSGLRFEDVVEVSPHVIRCERTGCEVNVSRNGVWLWLQVALNTPGELQFLLEILTSKVMGCAYTDDHHGSQERHGREEPDNQILPEPIKSTGDSAKRDGELKYVR